MEDMIFAILGSHPDISSAELTSVLGVKPDFQEKSVAFFDTEAQELTNLQQQLGGTIKLGHVIASFPHFHMEDIVPLLSSFLLDDYHEGKRVFSINYLDTGNTEAYKKALKMEKILGNAVKDTLKEEGFGARFVHAVNGITNAASLKHNKILEKGGEFILFFKNDELLIGKTEAFQDVDDWSYRDFERPGRDAKRGMLPPKLARIMINLAQPKEKETLLDPFCGSGTVLMEAGFVGYTALKGTDISEKAVEDTEKNLKWIQPMLSEASWELHTVPAEEADTVLVENSVDAIVTEPFLGKPRQGTETIKEVQRAVKQLEELYTRSFRTLERILKPGGSIVAAIPVHLVQGESFEPPIEKIIQNTGLKIDSSLPHLLYSRPQQFVARHIVRLTK